METDIYFEFDCKDDTKRSKGRKNRQQRDFKQFVKSGSVRKLILSDGKSDQHNDPFGLNCNVQYSLNKQGRWAKIRAMRSVDQLEDQTDAKVSTIENVYLDSTRLNLFKKSSKAFHEVDESGDVISRHAKRFAAQEKTLTEKPRLPSEQRKDSEIEEAIIPDATTHIRYEINLPHPSEKYWQQMAWRRHELPSGKVSNTRARRMERQLAVNCSDSDYFSNSGTESDAAEEIFTPEDRSKQKQFSLFDFITTAERKPKKAEGFVFLNAEN
jgi:hypothetical protein